MERFNGQGKTAKAMSIAPSAYFVAGSVKDIMPKPL